MRFYYSLIIGFQLVSASAYAEQNINIRHAIVNGLHYLESQQLSYGEFPTLFVPNIEEPKRSLTISYDSNLFTTAMIADAIHQIPHPIIKRLVKNSVKFIHSQLNNQSGLWSYFTTHNPAPLYPITVYDLDDTVFASMVLQRNKVPYPDNIAIIDKNKNQDGVYLTFINPPFLNDVDCGVNANILSYLKQNDPKVCEYLNNVVAQGTSCASYYSLLDAYYLISRAYTNGVTCLGASANTIIGYTLAQIYKWDKEGDQSDFKRAIALNILLDYEYRGPLIHKLINFLVRHQSKTTGSWTEEDFWLWTAQDDKGNKVLLGRSRSSSLTTALVLKALNRVKNFKLEPYS